MYFPQDEIPFEVASKGIFTIVQFPEREKVLASEKGLFSIAAQFPYPVHRLLGHNQMAGNEDGQGIQPDCVGHSPHPGGTSAIPRKIAVTHHPYPRGDFNS